MDSSKDQYVPFYRRPMHPIIGVGFIVLAVAIVFSTLFSMPYTGRIAARKSTCQGNLKQCAQALKMYSDDYNGQLPSSYLVSGSKRWNTRDFLAFTTRRGEYPPKANSERTIWQILYDNLRNRDAMWCPSDTVDRTDQHPRTSYWYKLANDKAWYGVGCQKPRRSLHNYAFPTDQIAFYEHCAWHFGDTKGLHNGVQVIASFMDSHVHTIAIKNATSGDPINCAANTDGEPMYYNFDAKTNKQDTGPAKHTDPTRYSGRL